MFKEYYTEKHRFGNLLVGGSDAQAWDVLWSSKSFTSDKQLEQLIRTPQWQAIARVAQKSWSVLEAGCGLGHWVRFFARYYLKPIGLDFSRPTIERLKVEFPTYEWVYGDIRAMEFDDSSFDMVVSWGVIEHFEEGPEKALHEVYRVLKQGGYFFVTVPWLSPARLRRGYPVDGDNIAKMSNGVPKFSQYYFTEKELVVSVEAAGFSVVRTRPAALHAKSLLPAYFRDKYKLVSKIMNRLLSPVLPDELIAHMILLVGKKSISRE